MDMADFDQDAYYVEREERMNVPDEAMQDYLKRLVSHRRSQESSFPGATSSRIPLPAQLSDISDEPSWPSSPIQTTGVMNKTAEIDSSLPTSDPGRSNKRGSSDMLPGTAAKRKRLADQSTSPDYRGPEINEQSSIVAAGPPGSGLISDAVFLRERSSSPPQPLAFNVVQVSSSVIPTSSLSPVSAEGFVPHATHGPFEIAASQEEPTAMREVSPAVASPFVIPSDDPITSFSMSSPKKRSGVWSDPAAVEKPIQLTLKPLNEMGPLLERSFPKTKEKIGGLDQDRFLNSTTTSSPGSPIEDVSILPSLQRPTVPPKNRPKMKPLAEQPSELFLEVKERIAKHSMAKQQRAKVVKLASRHISHGPNSTTGKAAEPMDESSIIYVSSSPSSRASSPPLPGSSRAKQVPKRPVEKRKVKGKKEKPPPMTPSDYARHLRAKLDAIEAVTIDPSKPQPKRKNSTVKFLQGKNIFYTGGDMRHASETTRGRMDIIVRFGGNLMPEFDPNVTTHIITDAQERPTLRALDLKSLKEIPGHIPTVRWSWLLTVIGRESILSQEEIDRKLGDSWFHAAFSERMDAGATIYRPTSAPVFKRKAKVGLSDVRKNDQNISVAEVSAPITQGVIVNHTSTNAAGPSHHPGAPPSPPDSPERPELVKQRAPSNMMLLPADPLAEFYHQAKAERLREDGWSSLGEMDIDEADDSDSELPSLGGPIPKRGWACDQKEVQETSDCPNQDIIDKLTELMELHKSKLGDDNHWRAFSYNKCLRGLRNYPRRIQNFDEARSIRGVGEKTARKIEEILQTGGLRRIQYENTGDVETTRLFQGIYGVGRSIAHQWYAAGCRSLQDLRAGKGGVKLTHVQETGLRYYDDINDRMPREEAKAIFDLIKPIALSIDPRLFIEIMGSYRRGKATCGDIDVLISRPIDDARTHAGVLPRLLRELHHAGILTEDLALPEDPNSLESTYRGLCRLPRVPGSKRRRIDFLGVPWHSRGAALLYYTGDDIFNRAIRLKANVLGYSLNQRGLFGNVVRDPHDRRIKMNEGVLVASETEEEIFKILGVPWQEPHERVRG